MTQTVIILVLLAGITSTLAYYYYRRAQVRPTNVDSRSYIEGLRAILRGQDEQAFTKLKETVSADTNNVDAYIQLGNILRRRKKTEQALQIHRDLTLRGGLSLDDKKEVLVALYHDFMAANDETSAVRAINEILSLVPEDRFALKALLRHHEQSAEWKEAAVVRKKLDKLDGGDSGKFLALYKVFEGYELAKQNDAHRARLFFKDALHLDKKCLAAYIAIGDSYFDEKRLEDALSYWTKVITLQPSDGHLVFERLKKGFFEVGRYGEYAESLTGLLQACPEHLTARLELAHFMEKKGENEGAREHYTVALDNHPESMLAKLGIYRLNREAGKSGAADAILKQLIKMAVKKEAANFRCTGCGSNAENKIWRCPRCKAIDSFESVAS